MKSKSEEPETGADQAQDKKVDVDASIQLGSKSGLQLDTHAVQEQVGQAVRPAVGELRERMAQVVHEQKSQTSERGPSGAEEPELAQETEEQPAQGSGSDMEQSARRSSGIRPEQSRSDHDRQGDNAMATENPGYAARAGLLRMARQWRDTGSTHQAIEAYKEILTNYPGTQVASAAVEELVELAQMMENAGQYHAALEVFRMLEQFGVKR